MCTHTQELLQSSWDVSQRVGKIASGCKCVRARARGKTWREESEPEKEKMERCERGGQARDGKRERERAEVLKEKCGMQSGHLDWTSGQGDSLSQSMRKGM